MLFTAGFIALLMVGPSGQKPAAAPSAAKFKYVLPEGFHGWACVDFGVEGAPVLERDSDGMYQIEPTQDAIVATASFPNRTYPPFPSEVVRTVDGQLRAIAVNRYRQANQRPSPPNPVSRWCLFFGADDEASLVKRPPKLGGSQTWGDPLPDKFSLEMGRLCDLRDSSRICVDGTDEGEKRNIAESVIAGLGTRPGLVQKRCVDSFDGLHVRYEATWAASTHSSARGPRFGFGEVRREQDGMGTTVVATWGDTDGGSALAVARRFGRDLAEFLALAAAASCPR